MSDEVIVRTDVTGGGADNQHSEELVVRTDVSAGGAADNQHAEGFIGR
jgi:hypothetical protein